MTTVFVLHHVREDDEFGDDTKLIGVYSTLANAEAAKLQLLGQPGFQAFPAGFEVFECILNTGYWDDGFVSMTRINMPLEHEETVLFTMVHVQDLHDGRYEIQGPMPDDEHWRFLPGTIVKCETVIDDGKECLVASSLA